jgi:hypothetical protein
VAAVSVMACDDGVEVPPLAGPSGLGLSIEMEANPAFVNADGASTSTITIVVRDSSGRPVEGKPLFVAHDGDGLLYPAGGGLGGLQTGISVATAGGGVARVVYRSGTAADRLVTIRCEPYSGDAGFTGEVPRSVVIHQR